MVGTFKELSQSAVRALSTVAQGWRELMNQSGQALTRFYRRGDENERTAPIESAPFPGWSLLAGEVLDKGKELVVHLEVPGVDKEDLEIAVRDTTLHVRGERRFAREHIGGSYYVMERAYGTFERVVPLPAKVDVDKTTAELRQGVLTVRLPKLKNRKGRLQIS